MKKYLILTFTLLALILTFSSCAASKDSTMAGSDGYIEYPEAEVKPGVDTGATGGGEITDVVSEQKLITTVTMDLESKNYDDLTAVIHSKLKEAGGYIEQSDESSNYYSLRYASYTLRVPSETLDTFLESIKGSANVLRQSESSVDVTLTYADLEGRLTALRAEQQALNGMLEKATSVSESITIQDRLSTVRGEIESIEKQLRALSSKISYSTVHLTVNEVKEETIIETEKKTVWQRIADDFTENAEDVGEYFSDLFVGIIGSSPVLFAILVTILLLLAPPVLLIILIVVIVRKRKKKKAKNRETAKS